MWYFQNTNNKGADQAARMRRLVCACVVRKPLKTGFLALRPIWVNHLARYSCLVERLVWKLVQETDSGNGFLSVKETILTGFFTPFIDVSCH